MYFQVLKVGVVETRYVSLKFCRPWVIHAYKNLKGRGVHKDGDEGLTPMVGIHGGSYMSAHVLLNLLNELGKRDKMQGLPSILSLFRNEFN